MGTKIPILLCVDVEPDLHNLDLTRRDPWRGFEEFLAYFRGWRPRLASATGSPVRCCWFVRTDHQVGLVYGDASWPFDHYRREFTELQAAGDDLGLHVHSFRWDEAGAEWICDLLDPAWMEHCVRAGVDAFTKGLGRRPLSFRSGVRFMSDALMHLLDELGVRFDLSLEPGQKPVPAPPGERWLGGMPDLTGIPRHPYRPSRNHYRRPASWRARPAGNIRVIPLTTGTRNSPGWFGWGRGGKDVLTLDLAHESPTFCRIMDRVLADPAGNYLALVVRADITLHPHYHAQMEQTLNYIQSHPLRDRFVFTDPAAAMRLLGADGRDSASEVVRRSRRSA